MKRTLVYAFETEHEVKEFCRRLYQMKKDAPRSLKVTVAVTLERDANVRDTNGKTKSLSLTALPLMELESQG
jgi:hypothetical protein